MKTNEEDESLFEDASKLAGALAHPLRLRLLKHLASSGACCVGDAVCDCGADQPTVSRHLSILRDAGLVQREVVGRKRIYSIVDPEKVGRILKEFGVFSEI